MSSIDPRGLSTVIVDPGPPSVGFGDIECEDICKAAARDPKLNKGGGGVLCSCQETCDGTKECKKCACAFGFPTLNIAPGECPAIDADVLDHEMKHFGDGPCTKLGTHRLQVPIGRQDEVECPHRRASLENLRRAVENEPSGKCKRAMEILIRNMEIWVEVHCGGGGLPDEDDQIPLN